MLAFLNIRPGEGRPVGLMLLLALSLGIGFVFVQTAAFAMFIARFGAQQLPAAYLAIAVLVSIMSVTYLRLSVRLPFGRLLVINLTFLMTLSFLFGVGLNLPIRDVFIFILPVGFQATVNLGNLAVWTLAGRLFDVRQSKRLFGLIGAGNWIATIATGLIAGSVASAIGTPNLFFASGLFILLTIVILRIILGTYGDRLTTRNPDSAQAEAVPTPIAQLLKNRYFVLIFAVTVLWWLAFYFIDNIFYSLASTQYPNADDLAGVIGGLISAQGLIALLFSTVLTAPIITRLGLRAALLLTPALLLAIVGALAVIGTVSQEVAVLFWLGAAAKVFDIALGFSIDQSGRLILFQPLPPEERSRLQTITDGIVQPFAVGLAGLALLLFNTLLGFSAVQLAYLFVLIGGGWLVAVVVLMRVYPTVLKQALSRRRFSANSIDICDPSTRDVLEQGLASPYAESVVYALDLLEQADVAALTERLPALLDHPQPEVRMTAARRITRLKIDEAAAAIGQRIDAEVNPAVRELLLYSAAQLGDPVLQRRVTAALTSTDHLERRGALTGLLSADPLDPISNATLDRLAQSGHTADRQLAAQVAGMVGGDVAARLLPALLHDDVDDVRYDSVEAAGKAKITPIWSLVVDQVANNQLRAVAMAALSAGGDSVLPAIAQGLSEPSQPETVRLRLARACGRVRSPAASALLRQHMHSDSAALRTEVFASMCACEYESPDREEILALVNREAADATWMLTVLADIGDPPELRLLRNGLERAVGQARERILYLLAFIYDRDSLLRIRSALLANSQVQRAYAVELIDTLLPSTLKSFILPLIEDSSTNRAQRLSARFPQEHRTRDARLVEIVERTTLPPWLRAAAIAGIGLLNLRTAQSTLTTALESPEALVRDATRWALNRIDPTAHSSAFGSGDEHMLSTLERVLILRTISLFEDTPDDVLVEVASLLEEVRLPAHTVLFEKGDLGQSMYFVVTGGVNVQDGDQTIFTLGERGVFGELALLDSEPRTATVTTQDETLLLRLDQEPFYELMSDYVVVMRGVVRFVTRRLRERIGEISTLQGHGMAPTTRLAVPAAKS